MIVICDIDGTIADCSHRLHLIKDKPKNWNKFHELCIQDKVVENIQEIVWCLNKFHIVIYITGRPESSRELTEKWLANHSFPEGDLYMRKDGDYRQDWITKAEHLDKVLIDDVKILCALEDRDQVCDMWREKGVTCLQVKKGDY